MHLQVPHLLSGTEHRLDDELRRDLPGEAEQQPCLDHRLGQERKVGRSRSGDCCHGVHQPLGHAHDRPEMRERLLGESDVGVVGVGAGTETRNPFVDDGRRVRHRSHDRDSRRQVTLDRGSRDRRRDGEERLLARDQVADLAEQRLDVLRLDGDHDERGLRDGLLVRERGRDAVPLGELRHSLRPAAGRDDVVRYAPAG